MWPRVPSPGGPSIPHAIAAARRRLYVELLRSVQGIWIWAALLRRELLAVPSAIFRLLESHEGQVPQNRHWHVGFGFGAP